MGERNRLLASLGAALLILFAVVGFAASLSQSNTSTVDVVQVDFNRLISAAVKDRNRFAVDIPRIVDASQAGIGSWSVVRGLAIWRYSMRVPTAASLSFHAANIFLPPSAQLKVTAGGNTYLYGARDTNKRQLWSRISKGDSLTWNSLWLLKSADPLCCKSRVCKPDTEDSDTPSQTTRTTRDCANRQLLRRP